MLKLLSKLARCLLWVVLNTMVGIITYIVVFVHPGL